MSETECKSLEDVLFQLEQQAPGAPLLALGQTIFWDEPMKAGVALKIRKLGLSRRFVAGVHDTDYFAKIPGGRASSGRFKTLPHNDTTTRGLWSAAGEFSALFGSETVVTRDALGAAGVRVDSLAKQRPKFLDEITEAWGWRGIVSLEDSPPITAELPIGTLFPELMNAFKWACDSSFSSLSGQGRQDAERLISGLLSKAKAAKERTSTLSEFYRALLPDFYEFVANAPVAVESTATTELLRFNRETYGLPRFELLGLFLDPKTRAEAVKCYDEAIKGSPGLYELSRFGTGSIPFDLVIPGHGRGTIRIGNRGAVIMTPRRQFLSFKTPIGSLKELAELVEKKFGPNCTLVGKAVSLIGMLGREFVFVFHAGASGYVGYSRKLHNLLAQRTGVKLAIHPILRVSYSAWDSLDVCCSWLKLPEIIGRAFGTEELCAPSFATRWREVGREQQELLTSLSLIRRPIELIRHLDRTLGGSWKKLAEEYESLFGRLQVLRDALKKLAGQRDDLYGQLGTLRQNRVAAEVAKGRQFREKIFDKSPTEADRKERENLTEGVNSLILLIRESEAELRQVRQEQHRLAQDPEIKSIYERRRSIELEAELKKARLIRAAIVSSKGLAQAGVRPSAWWFPLVCPDGLWFRETIETAGAWLEPLV
jgi:hypothetical protein